MLRRQIKVSLVPLLLMGSLMWAQSGLCLSESDLIQFMSPQERQIHSIRQKEIQGVTAVLQRRAPKDHPPELLFRLAELYIESSRLYYLKENEYSQKNNTKFVKLVSDGYLKRALDTFESISRLPKPPAKMDEIFFRLGYYYGVLGDSVKSIANYRKVVQQFPQSEFVAEAHLGIGEYLMSRQQHQEALQYLTDAAKATENRFYTKVLYNLGWVYYRLQNYQQAIFYMKRCIEVEEADTQNRYVKMKESALSDLAVFFTDGGSPDEAKEYLRLRGGEKEYFGLLKRLSSNYERKGMVDSAVKVNQEIISLSRDLDERLQFRLANVRLLQRTRNWKQVIGAYAAMLDDHGPSSEYAKSAGGTKEREVQVGSLESNLRGLATQTHREAQRTKNRALYSAAKEMYELYLKHYPQGTHTDEMRYYLVETLVHEKNNQEAIRQIKMIQASQSESKFKKEASVQLLAIYNEELKKTQNEKSGTIAPMEQEYIASVDDFIRMFPKDPKAPELLFSTSGILSRRNLSAQAFARNENIIKTYPGTAAATAAAKMNIDIKIASKDTEALQRLVAEYQKDQAFAQDQEFRSKLGVLSQDASFSQVAELEKGSKFEEAAKSYEALYLKETRPNLKQAALNNAIANFEKAGKRDQSFRLMGIYVATYPKDKASEGFLWAIAQGDFVRFKYREASEGFLRFAKEYPESNRRTDAMLTAGLILEGMDQLDRSLQAYSQVLGLLPNTDPRSTAVLFRMVDLLERSNRKTQANELIERYIRQGGGLRAMEAVARRQYSSPADREAAFRAAKARPAGKNARELYFSGMINYASVDPIVREYKAIRLALPTDALRASIARKLALKNRIQEEYVKVISVGSPEWVVASFLANGEIVEDLRDSILRAPVPPGLNPDQMKQYNQVIQNQTAPLLKSAQENYVLGLQKAGEFRTASTFVERLRAAALRSKAPSLVPVQKPLTQINPLMAERIR